MVEAEDEALLTEILETVSQGSSQSPRAARERGGCRALVLAFRRFSFRVRALQVPGAVLICPIRWALRCLPPVRAPLAGCALLDEVFRVSRERME